MQNGNSERRVPGPSWSHATKLLALMALASAGCLGSCDPDCDSTKEDCSLSTTCCTPPTVPPPTPGALSLACRNDGSEGDLDTSLTATLLGGTAPYNFAVTWGDGIEGRGAGGSNAATGALFRLDHTYPRPTSLESRTYAIRVTANDSAAQTQTCSLSHRVDVPRLDIDCDATPRVGEAPLTVTFEARRNDCVGDCRVTWTFGDGDTYVGDSTVHTYTQPGPPPFYTWAAGATLRDGAGRETRCNRPIQVTGPATTPGNRPPTIAAYTAAPTTIFIGQHSQLRATLTDPDGDPVSWTLSLDPGSAPGNFSPASGTGNLVSDFNASGPGQATIRLVINDGRGGSAQAAVTVTVIFGGG